MNFYKKLGVKKETAKPGDLLKSAALYPKVAALAKKHSKRKEKAMCKKHGVAMTDSHMREAHGKMMKKDAHVAREARHEGHSYREEASEHGIKAKKHRKNWIQNAIKKPGALHRQLGVKQGEKIPAAKLGAAAKKGGKLGRRARLALTLKGLKKA